MDPKITKISTRFTHGRILLCLIRGDRNALVDTGMHGTPARDIAHKDGKLVVEYPEE